MKENPLPSKESQFATEVPRNKAGYPVDDKEAAKEQKKRMTMFAAATAQRNGVIARMKQHYTLEARAKLPQQLIMTSSITPSSLHDRWYKHVKYGGNPNMYPAYASKYNDELKGANLMMDALRTIEQVKPNPVVGCGFLCGIMNTAAENYQYVAAAHRYTDYQDFHSFWQSYERNADPILDPTAKFNYSDTLRWASLMIAVGMKFMPTPYTAFDWMRGMLTRQQGRMNALAIATISGKCEACKGVDNTSQLGPFSDYRASNQQLRWTTADLINIARDSQDPDYKLARMELAYRSSAFYLTNWMKKLAAAPSVKLNTWKSMLSPQGSGKWLLNYDLQTRQHQAYTKAIMAGFYQPTSYRTKITDVDYNIYCYLGQTVPTEEQVAKIRDIGIEPMKGKELEAQTPKIVKADPEKEVPEDDNIDKFLGEEFTYTGRSRVNKAGSKPKVKDVEEEEDGDPIEVVQEDFSSGDDAKAEPERLKEVDDYILEKAIGVAGDAKDDEIATLRTLVSTAIIKWRSEGIALTTLEQADGQMEQVNEVIKEWRKILTQDGKLPPNNDPYVTDPLKDWKEAAEQREDKQGIFGKITSTYKGTMAMARVAEQINSSDLIKKTANLVDSLHQLREKMEENATDEKLVQAVQELQPLLVKLNEASNTLLTKDTMHQVQRILDLSEKNLAITADFYQLFRPIIDGIHQYIPEEIKEMPTLARVLKNFPYKSFIAMLIIFRKVENKTVRAAAVMNFAVQAGLGDIIFTLFTAAWNWISNNASEDSTSCFVADETCDSGVVETPETCLFSSVLTWVKTNTIPIGLTTAVCATLLSIFLVRTPKKSEVDDFTATIHEDIVNMGKVSAGISWIFVATDKIKNLIMKAANKLYKMITGKDWSAPDTPEAQVLKELHMIARFYNSPEGRVQLVKYQEHRDSCAKVLNAYHEAYIRVAKDATSAAFRYAQHMQRDMRDLEENHNTAMHTQSNEALARPVPIVGAFVGMSGTGKTAVTNLVAKDLIKYLYPSEQSPEKLFTTMDATGKEFQDAIQSHHRIVIIDDFNSFNDFRTVSDFLNLVSNAPMVLNKAHLQDKGQTVKFEFLLMSSNRKTLRAEGVNCAVAFDRRRHALFNCRPVAELMEKVKNGVLATSDIDAWQRAYKEKHGRDPKPFEHIRFYVVNPVKPEANLDSDHIFFKIKGSPFNDESGKPKDVRTNPLDYDGVIQLLVDAHKFYRNLEGTHVDTLRYYREDVLSLRDAYHYYMTPRYTNVLEEWIKEETDGAVKPTKGQLEQIRRRVAAEALRKRDECERMYDMLAQFAELNQMSSPKLKVPDFKMYEVEEDRLTVALTPAKSDKNNVERDTLVVENGKPFYKKVTCPSTHVPYVNGGYPINVTKIKDPKSGNPVHVKIKGFSLDKTKNFQTFYLPNSFQLFTDRKGLNCNCDIEFLRRIHPVGSTEILWYGKGDFALENIRDSEWFLSNLWRYSNANAISSDRWTKKSLDALYEAIADCVDEELEPSIEAAAGNRKYYFYVKKMWSKIKKGCSSVWEAIPELCAHFAMLASTVCIGVSIWLIFVSIAEIVKDETTGAYGNSLINRKEVAASRMAAQRSTIIAAKTPDKLSSKINAQVDPEVGAIQKASNNCRLFECYDVNEDGSEEVISIVNGFGLKGNYYFVPKHAMSFFLKHKIKMSLRNVPENQFRKMRLEGYWYAEGTDCALVMLSGDSQVPDITHLVAETVQMQDSTAHYNIQGYRLAGHRLIAYERNSSWRGASSNKTIDGTDMVNVILVDGMAKKGDSGSPCFSMSTKDSTKPLMGIVSGMNNKGITYISVITRNLIEDLLNAAENEAGMDSVSISTEATTCCWAPKGINEDVPVELIHDGKTVDFVGIITDEKFIADPFPRSVIRPSPIKQQIDVAHPPKRVPVVIGPHDPRWEPYHELTGISHPLSPSLMKATDVNQTPLPEHHLCAARDAIADHIIEVFDVKRSPLRVYTVREALHNSEDRLNPHTSAGFPYKATHPGPGKTGLFRFDEKGEISFLDPQFEADCIERANLYRVGIAKTTTSYVFAKDELRTMEKMYKPRQIDTYPADENTVWRMFNQDFASRFYEAGNGDNPWCPGLDVHSQWPILASRLAVFSNNAMDIDASAWDGHMHARLFKVTAEIKNLVYQDEYQLARLTQAANACSHTVQFGPYLYRKHGGMGSGWAGTTVDNTLAHMALFYTLYRIIMERAWYGEHHEDLKEIFGTLDRLLSWKTFLSLVVPRFYSDDFVCTVSPLIAHILRPDVVADAYKEFGWKVTSATKQATKTTFRHLSEVQFLKRSFRFDQDLAMWLPPLEFDTIADMVRYVRASHASNVRAQFLANVGDAFDEAAYHGKDKYNMFCSWVISAAQARDMFVPRTSWEDKIRNYMDKAYNTGVRGGPPGMKGCRGSDRKIVAVVNPRTDPRAGTRQVQGEDRPERRPVMGSDSDAQEITSPPGQTSLKIYGRFLKYLFPGF